MHALELLLKKLPPGAGYFGIDPSMTGTGLCFISKDMVETKLIRTKHTGYKRLDEIASVVERWMIQYSPQVVVIEGYAYDARYSREVAGEVQGQIRLSVVRTGIPFYSVAPCSLKRFITGKGKAHKDEIGAAFDTKFDAYAKTIRHNISDAYALALCGVALNTGNYKDLKYQVIS